MSLSESTRVYQSQLETLRVAEDCGEFDERALEQLREDLARARQLMEVAWLEQTSYFT